MIQMTEDKTIIKFGTGDICVTPGLKDGNGLIGMLNHENHEKHEKTGKKTFFRKRLVHQAEGHSLVCLHAGFDRSAPVWIYLFHFQKPSSERIRFPP